MNKNIKRAGIVGGVVSAAVVGGIAFAAFTTTGNFGAAGQVHNAPVALDAAGGQIETLYPGGCSDVTVTFSNSNDHAAKVDATTLASGSAIGATLNGATSNLLAWNPNTGAVLTPAVVAAGQAFTVPAGGQASFTLPNLLCLDGDATNAVAGQTVAISGHVPFVLANDTEYTG